MFKPFNAKTAKDELIAWIAAYFRENAAPDTRAVIGVSGGKDSSVCAALLAAALGPERVLGILMPQGEQADIADAYELCRILGIKYVEINIAAAVDGLYAAVETAGLGLNNIATINTPARLRMTTLYAVSAIVGGRVANTCNRSEDWIGYSTKYGDAAGDFSPLSHFTVGEVKAIGRELGLPARFIDKTPADGLCGKSDEENLGFTYELLDEYIRTGVCPDPAIKEKIDRLHAMNLHKMQPMPAYEHLSLRA